jgi:hypothetical protein
MVIEALGALLPFPQVTVRLPEHGVPWRGGPPQVYESFGTGLSNSSSLAHIILCVTYSMRE